MQNISIVSIYKNEIKNLKRFRSAEVVYPVLTPAFAVGSALIGSTVIVTVSVLTRPSPSVTVSSKTRVFVSPFATSGEVNVGLATVLDDSVTASPSICAHENVTVVPLGSLPLPCKVTVTFSSTTWSLPASAINSAGLTSLTVNVIVSGSLSTMPSFTINSNVSASVVSASTFGAVNVGYWSVVDDRATAGPSVCDHMKVNASPSGSSPEPASLAEVFSETV